MSSPQTTSRASGAWVDTVAAVLLALAAVATAWSSYQASRWTGEQAKAFSAANAARVEATQASNLANAQKEVDVNVFTQWVDAHLHDDHRVQTFYEQRFRDEFEPAFNAWLETDPFSDATAPESPFAMTQYVVAADQQAAQLTATADATAEAAKVDVQRATNYVLGVVLFAVALFFAGVSPKLSRPRLRIGILAVGIVVFMSAAIWIATFPVSFSI
ncbi:MAG: hypothetical protein ACJ72Y_02130 [Actinomycetes bacterium]